MRAFIIGMCSFLLGGCALFTTERETVAIPPPFYTQAETDAINAEIQCKNLARTPVQIARCSTRR